MKMIKLGKLLFYFQWASNIIYVYFQVTDKQTHH